MSTSSRTHLAVLIYEFTNCVCFCYRKNTKKLQQPRHGTSDAVIKHDVQEWFKFGVKYDGRHQRQRQSQSGLCNAAGETKRKRSHVLTLVINAMQTMAWKDLSSKWQSCCHVKWHTGAHLSCFVIFVLGYVTN